VKRPRWYLPEEVAAALRVSVEDLHRLCDARQCAVLILPNGERRFDAASFGQFVRVHQLGYVPTGQREPA
jgi:hypothetical protein